MLCLRLNISEADQFCLLYIMKTLNLQILRDCRSYILSDLDLNSSALYLTMRVWMTQSLTKAKLNVKGHGQCRYCGRAAPLPTSLLPLAVRRNSHFHPSLVKSIYCPLLWSGESCGQQLPRPGLMVKLPREASGCGKADAMREGGVNIR